MHSAFLIALCLGNAVAEQETANPIRKIVGMLQDMQKELEREAENEGELFDKAMCACEEGAKSLGQQIAEAGASVETLTAKVKEETAEKSTLAQELSDHYASKDSAEADLSQATVLREKESKAFAEGEKTAKANVQALGGAIGSLSGGASASSLMQMSDSPRLRKIVEVSKFLTPDARQKVLVFFDQGMGDAASEPSAGVAEIVGILKSMGDSMSKDLADMQKQEQADFTNYGVLKEAKLQEISAANAALISKEKRSGALAVSLSENKHALEDATSEKANSEKYLADMTSECATKKKERGMRNQMRTEEIAALSDAVKILNEDDALETFKKAVPSFTQRKEYDALLQLPGKQAPRLVRARRIIAGLETKRPSAQLKLLLLAIDGKNKAKSQEEPGSTAEYATGAAKVVDTMIDGMVHVLHDEDVGDEHKKEWCANETETMETLSTEKHTLSDQIKTELAELADNLAGTEEEIKTLEEMIALTDKNVFEATEQRKKEHQEFVDSFTTMASALRLLDKAMIRLGKFYSPKAHHKAVETTKSEALKKAGLSLLTRTQAPTLAVQRMIASFDDTALIEKSSAHSKLARVVLPETPGTYEKMESGGVIELMNKMKSDIKVDMTEAETEEKNSAKDYARAMKDAQESRAQDTKSLNHEKEVKAATEMKITDAKELHMLTENEIHNLDLYMAQMHTECDFLVRNFEVRHDGRIGEEVGLEEAKSIVTGEEPPNHRVVEEGYDSEHSDAEVEEHFVDGHHIHEGDTPPPPAE